MIAWHGIKRQIIWIFCRESEVSQVDSLIEDHSFSAEFVRWIEAGKADLKHLRVFILNNSFSQFPYFY